MKKIIKSKLILLTALSVLGNLPTIAKESNKKLSVKSNLNRIVNSVSNLPRWQKYTLGMSIPGSIVLVGGAIYLAKNSKIKNNKNNIITNKIKLDEYIKSANDSQKYSLSISEKEKEKEQEQDNNKIDTITEENKEKLYTLIQSGCYDGNVAYDFIRRETLLKPVLFKIKNLGLSSKFIVYRCYKTFGATSTTPMNDKLSRVFEGEWTTKKLDENWKLSESHDGKSKIFWTRDFNELVVLKIVECSSGQSKWVLSISTPEIRNSFKKLNQNDSQSDSEDF